MRLYNTQFCNGLPALIPKEDIVSEIEYLNNPQNVHTLCVQTLHLHDYTEEYLYAFALDAKKKILGIFEISHGTVNSTLASPREIFIRLLLLGAVDFILAHNHPSQNTEPSDDDIRVTNRIVATGKLIGIQLCDHVIISETEFYSMAEHHHIF